MKKDHFIKDRRMHCLAAVAEPSSNNMAQNQQRSGAPTIDPSCVLLTAASRALTTPTLQLPSHHRLF